MYANYFDGYEVHSFDIRSVGHICYNFNFVRVYRAPLRYILQLWDEVSWLK